MSVSFSAGVNRSIVCSRVSRSCCAIEAYTYQDIIIAREIVCTVPSLMRISPSIPQSPHEDGMPKEAKTEKKVLSLDSVYERAMQ